MFGVIIAVIALFAIIYFLKKDGGCCSRQCGGCRGCKYENNDDPIMCHHCKSHYDQLTLYSLDDRVTNQKNDDGCGDNKK